MILDAGLSEATLCAADRGRHQVVSLDVPVTSTTKIGNRYPYQPSEFLGVVQS
jgi:hypothetical protein